MVKSKGLFRISFMHLNVSRYKGSALGHLIDEHPMFVFERTKQ
jgi:hypothetical protein